MKIFIIGAGISGLASALALAHELPDAEITVFERHEILSTSGGAINLTPVAQRHLARLGVLEELGKMGGAGGIEVSAIELFSLHSGRGLGKISFTDAQGEAIGGFKGRRVMRIVLSVAMLAVAERHAQISVVFGKKLVDVEHDDEKDEKKAGGVTARFDDGTAATADLLLGCDGVHSSVRRFVDPACVSEYTGISFIQTTIAAETMTRARKHFHTSAMHVSRHGSLLTSFCDAERETLFVAAIVQMDEHSIASLRLEPLQDGRTQQAIKSAIRQGVVDRFGRSAIPWVRELVAQDADWMVYPVYQVEPGSRWCSNRIVLLGDAAHAMPPRDESAAFALDDAILFARILGQTVEQGGCLEQVFTTYETLRRQIIETAFKASRRLWGRHRDMSLLEGCLREWLLPYAVRTERKEREAAWRYDPTELFLNNMTVDD